MRIKLTATNIKKLDLPEGKSDMVYWDVTVPAFGVRVRGKSTHVTKRGYIVQYRTSSKLAPRKMDLGDVLAVELTKARSTAKGICWPACTWVKTPKPRRSTSGARQLSRSALSCRLI